MFLTPAGRIAIGAAAVLTLILLITFTMAYVRYSRIIDRKLAGNGPFQATSMVFAAPRVVAVGDEITSDEIVAQLRASGYGETSGARMGWFHLRPDGAVEIFPGPDSYFDDEAGVIKFSGKRVSQIISLRDNTERVQYLLEPELITNLSDRSREKRRLVKYKDIPKVLVDAVVSAEDKRFFQHAGFDPLRVIKVAFLDLKEGKIRAGASTLSMQLARLFWLTPSRTFKRKAEEVMITFQLEQKLSKEQIFEFYANQVPLGQRGSFAIHGFGEAAHAFFGKDIGELTLPEAATLAGLIQQPSRLNPYRHPQAARDRRNIVLGMMKENGYISELQYRAAIAEPLAVAPAAMESTEAPYFVDLVNDELQSEFGDYDFQSSSYRVYTSLDLNLQHAAAEAVRIGMAEVDKRLARRRWPAGVKPPQAQCALVAIDPETGQVKALLGGRDYGVSQLNRALAKRQPGSSFKPFVYAAALNTALGGGTNVITPVTKFEDEPTTFWFDDKPYSPENFKKQYNGEVTLRYALAHSLNIPTVRIAEMVGYDAVESLAKRAGMNINIRATPAIALGAYEVTPLEVAASYTIFANQGVYVKPSWVNLIRDRQGNVLFQATPDKRQVLDPRVAYMMESLMEEVLRTGSGAGVRARGFTLPAAGKTGTSHDGWFVGFTSRLICAVWVGFDDNRQLNLEGAHSALPIWTEFMKRAHQYREYRNVHEFAAPDGIVTVEIDPQSGQLATPQCPLTRPEVFFSGTQPVETCALHGGTGGTRVASWESAPPLQPSGSGAPVAASPQFAKPRLAPPPNAVEKRPPEQGKAEEKKEDDKKKGGLLHRIWGVFK
ncbi:MAG: penicillin-binding protein 1A [Acidobacteriota bacterium]